MGSPNQAKITKNLSCQKTESTIVLAILQSTGTATKEERKMPPKWSSGRACGAASTTQGSLRFAALAHYDGQDGKDKRCTEGAKRPQQIMYVFNKIASTMRKSGTQNETKSSK